MDLTDADIKAFTTSIDGRFVIFELVEPVEARCSNPDCQTEHLTDVLLMDRECQALVPCGSVREAREHVANLGLTVGWDT